MINETERAADQLYRYLTSLLREISSECYTNPEHKHPCDERLCVKARAIAIDISQYEGEHK